MLYAGAVVVAAYLACALIWGTTWYAIRVCIGPGGYPTLEAAALRFAVATVLLLAACALRGERLRAIPSGQRRWLVLAGLLDAAGYALVYLGEERVPGGLAAVLFATQPLLLAVLLWFHRIEPLRRGAVMGAVVSLAGVGLLVGDRAAASASQVAGIALVLGAVVASTGYMVIIKRHGRGVSALAQTTIFLGVTALALGAVVLARGPAMHAWPARWEPTAALLYLAVFGSVVAFGAYFWLLERISLMASSTLVFVMPLVSLAVDAAWERQVRLDAGAYLGVVVVLGGLALGLLVDRRAPD